MLTQVQAFALGVTAPDFPVADQASDDPIQIRNIDGLEPVPATVNTTQYGSVDGEFYNGSSVGKRNIVLTFGLNPNWVDQTIEGLRRLLYAYFLPGQAVKLIFDSTHMPQVKIEGYIESFEPNIFSKDPEIQVSVVCPSPYFVATAMSAASGVTIAFADATTTPVQYDGDVAVGYVLDVVQQSGGAVVTNGEVRVINNTPTVQLLSTLGVTVNSSQFFRVSTVKGNKYVNHMSLTGGAAVNILGKVAPGSIWSPLRRGINNFQVKTPTAGLTWTLQYYSLYGGL